MYLHQHFHDKFSFSFIYLSFTGKSCNFYKNKYQWGTKFSQWKTWKNYFVLTMLPEILCLNMIRNAEERLIMKTPVTVKILFKGLCQVTKNELVKNNTNKWKITKTFALPRIITPIKKARPNECTRR